MKKHGITTVLLAALMFTSIPQANPITDTTIVAEAHGGRTDAKGGHKDNKNASGLGSYHYHCGGYPAHLHTNGVCPYASGGSASSSTAAARETAAPAETAAQIIQETAAAQQFTPGWHKDGHGWKYYYSDLTCAKSRWELINDKYYCFGDNEYLYVDTCTPDGYWVNENGEWIE